MTLGHGCPGQAEVRRVGRSRDQTKSRAPIAPEWRQVQNTALRDGELGLARLRAGRRRGSLRKLMPLLVGCLASYTALTGGSSLREVNHDGARRNSPVVPEQLWGDSPERHQPIASGWMWRSTRSGRVSGLPIGWRNVFDIGSEHDWRDSDRLRRLCDIEPR